MAKDYLGKYANLHGKTIKKEVEPAKPIGNKGVAGKGMPNTCNYMIPEKIFERELREYQAKLAAEEAAKIAETESPDPAAEESVA